MKSVCVCRTARWALGPLVAWMIGVSAFGQEVGDWGAGSATAAGLGEKFMKLVIFVQSATSVDWLNDVKTVLRATANAMAEDLGSKKMVVENCRDEIKLLDGSLQEQERKMNGSGDAAVVAEAKSMIASLKEKRKKLVEEEARAYKQYARYRGKCIVASIMFEAVVKEADKRIGELGNNTARGTWAGSYVGEDGKKEPQSGRFSLLIDPNTGAISGSYTAGGDVPVSGKWDKTTGGCSGTGNDPEAPASFSGTLTRGAAGYTGSGGFSYTYKTGGSGSGTWTAK